MLSDGVCLRELTLEVTGLSET